MNRADLKQTDVKAAKRRRQEAAPADNVLAYVHMLSNRIGRAFHPEIETKFGVTNHEWRVMMSLARDPGITAAEITARWGMEKMAASRAIRRLERDNHVRRLQNPCDKRSYTLELTRKGLRLYDKILPTATARYHEIVAPLNRDELRAVETALAKLIDQAARLER